MAIIDKALSGRVALVTGGSRGIGRAVCKALAQRGAKVIINYRSREDAARETAELVTTAGGEAVLAGFDVADGEAVRENIKALAKEHGGLHILVNNAGIAINGLMLRFKEPDWQKCVDVNLTGTYHCTQAASKPLLKAKAAGRIINITSVVGETGNPGQAAYAATKAGIIGFTKSLAREFASRGVCVNAISPGYIETDMTNEDMPEAAREAVLASIPFGRMGNPEEVADAVAFLAGPEAQYITGQVLRVNGGMLI
jgi:3-oxoacyl-[acyl-carrier protein] reductase